MKNILLHTMLCALLLMSSTLSAQIKWYTLDEALTAAKKEPRPILVDLYTTWCHYCKKLDKETFTNGVITKYINSKFYAVKIDAETRENILYKDSTFKAIPNKRTHPIAEYLVSQAGNNRLAYPTIVYLAADGQVLTSIAGYQAPKDMEPILHYMSDPNNYGKDFQKWREQHFKSQF